MRLILKIKLIAIFLLLSTTCNAANTAKVTLPTDQKLISFLNELFDNNAEFAKSHDSAFFDKFRNYFFVAFFHNSIEI